MHKKNPANTHNYFDDEKGFACMSNQRSIIYPLVTAKISYNTTKPNLDAETDHLTAEDRNGLRKQGNCFVKIHLFHIVGEQDEAYINFLR